MSSQPPDPSAFGDDPGEHSLKVDSIVAQRDFQPYLRLFADGQQVAQLSMAQARNVAMNIFQQCARAEADAMIHKFFSANEFPATAGAALMMEFRDFRHKLDAEPIETTESDPDTGAKV